MNLKKALAIIAAIAAMAAAAAACVVAAVYALYAVLRYWLEPAAAAAAMAVVCAILTAVLAMIAFRRAEPKRLARGADTDNTMNRLIELAREKPIIAAGAAVAAGLVILRNPAVITALVTAAMARRAREPDRNERRDRRR